MVKEFKKPYSAVYVKCHQAAIELNFDITREDIGGGEILFKVGMSWFSWGEKFKIVITRSGLNQTRVEIASEAAFEAQVIDWGKNDNNVQSFFETLNGLLKA